MSVREAVERDLAQIRTRSRELAESALAASALVLAGELDSAGNSATSKSMCAKALTETMDRLRELSPPRRELDDLDDLAARRERRRISGGDPDTAAVSRP